MMFGFFRVKCYFCGKKEGFFHSVHSYGCYGDVGQRVFYHPECLNMVQEDPRKYGNNLIDKAIFINDQKDRNIKDNKEIIENYKKQIERLIGCHFKRMLGR